MLVKCPLKPFVIPDVVGDLEDILSGGRHRHIRVVSFDVFDTVLWRLVSPRIVVHAAAAQLFRDLKASGFYIGTTPAEIVRHREEYVRNQRKSRFTGEWEWLLEDWLDLWAREWRLPSARVRAIGVRAELDSEMLFTRVGDGLPGVLERLRSGGLSVVATSATPLTSEQLTELLQYHGLHFDYVFSTGSFKASKRRGTIYEVVARVTGHPAASCLHVGDEIKNDVLWPLIQGFRVKWAPNTGHKRHLRPIRHQQLAGEDRSRLLDLDRALYLPPVSSERHTLYRLGFNHLAPLVLLFSFVQWRRFREQRVEQVFYIARDGKTFLDAYDLLADLLPDSPERHYIRLSRQSVSLAGPRDPLLSLAGLPGKVGRATVGEFLSSFKLPSDLCESILATGRLDGSAPFNQANQQRLLRSLQLHNDAIQSCRDEQSRLLDDYIRQESAPLRPARIGLVDTGWGCTTQDAIWHSLGQTTTVSGCYLGVSFHGLVPSPSNLKYGLLRDDFRNLRHANAMDRTAGAVRLWDMVFREPAPTVERLVRTDDGRIKPVYSEGTKPGAAEIASREQLWRGMEEGLLYLRPALRAMVALAPSWTQTSIEAAASALTRSVVSRPDADIARSIMRLSLDEGSAGGRKGSIGLAGLSSRTTWYAGVLSQYGLGVGCAGLECAAELRVRSTSRVSY